jgi:hypothetical protein
MVISTGIARVAAAVMITLVMITLAAFGPVGEGGRYGAGAGAVCGTDAQCRAYAREVLLDLDART